MKLLILTQYFPPEIGAPQNRLSGLAMQLQKLGVRVTVLTAMPNYPQMEIYENYRGKKYVLDQFETIPVHRCSILVSKNKSIVARLGNYFSFVFSSARASRKLEDHYDFLMCESPPLFLAYSAFYLARKKRARLIFNVSDLWPESAEKLGVVTNRWLLKMAYRLEGKAYRDSVLVTGQTQGICKNIAERFPSVSTYWLPNGVDLSLYDPEKPRTLDWRKLHGFSASDQVFFYGGILGLAQGLEIILNAAEHFRQNASLHFVLMGTGPERHRLMEMKQRSQLANVHIFEPVPREMMEQVLAQVDAVIVPLRDLALFRGAIPSKVFEALAMKLPVLLGVSGEAKELFVDQGQCGVYFEPGNVNSLCAAIRQVLDFPQEAERLGENGRQFVGRYFNREKIALDFFERLRSL